MARYKKGTVRSRQQERQRRSDRGTEPMTPSNRNRRRREMGMTSRMSGPIIDDMAAMRRRIRSTKAR